MKVIGMVIVKLMGGLGNQMFQYAAARRIALVNNLPLKLDLSWYEHYQLRPYSLKYLNISEAIASPDDITRVKGGGSILGRITRHIERIKPYYRRSWVIERQFNFDPNILQVFGPVYLEGYWQSEKYFKEIEHILRQEFTVKSRPDPLNEAIARNIQQTNSVSLHIRRGDYLSNPAIHQIYGVCSLEYYHTAIEKLVSTVEKPYIFIFSDDSCWAQENLKLAYPLTYVTHNGADKDYEDLRLMSLCQHNIIANSTFSWWAAWLNANPNKIVLAPRRWFNVPIDTRDLFPDGWIKV